MLSDGALGKPNVAMEIVAVEYRVHVAYRVPGYGRDLWHGAFGEREP
jgi:hypothetical protein